MCTRQACLMSCERRFACVESIVILHAMGHAEGQILSRKGRLFI